jgi:hypothetical protein
MVPGVEIRGSYNAECNASSQCGEKLSVKILAD